MLLFQFVMLLNLRLLVYRHWPLSSTSTWQQSPRLLHLAGSWEISRMGCRSINQVFYFTQPFLIQGVLESFMGHLLAGGVFCLLAGQPLTVLGCTGPVLIFEKILVEFCEQYGIYYLTLRLWIGLWSALFCIIIVAVDGSAIVRSRFS